MLRDEVSRPDGIIIKNKGKELEIHQDKQLAEEHLKLMDRDAQSIRNAGGVTDENLGRGSNAQSGKAIIARQTQGSVVTAEIFDNYLLSFQIQGENLLSLAEQYYTMNKVIRLTGQKKGVVEWREINKPQADGTYMNDITNTKADFLIDEQDYRETMRQAMFEQMMDMVTKMPPAVALNMLDLVFEYSDVQGKDEIVARIRKINGQSAADDKKTPEDIQAEQAMQQQQAEQLALAKRTAEAAASLAEAKVANLTKQTDKLESERLVQMVTAMYEALQSGQIVASVPGVAPVADEILKGAGYQVTPGGQDPAIPAIPATQVQPGIPQPPVSQDMQPTMQPLKQGDGSAQGIQTMANDGSQ
jgi:DNA-binding FrmR family transcriptional regulator